ncbi:MAG TPA: tetratricopeptide repeat protein [Gemmatimonadaceae bacterium]
MSVASTRRAAVLAIAVAVIAALPFLPSLQNGFVSWDDDKNFLANLAYRGLGWSQLRWMWTTFHLGHYVPLSWMTLGLDYSLWGMDARGYHLTSLIIHAANAAVLFLVARRLLSLAFGTDVHNRATELGAAFAALVFAMHPLRVESVAWVTERRDVLSGLLYSLTVLLYLGAMSKPTLDRTRYVASVIVFAMALLSKATAMTVPAVLFLINVYPLKRLPLADWRGDKARQTLRELIPFAALTIGAMLLSIIALSPGEQLSFWHKLAVSAYGFSFYLWKLAVPVRLAPYYPLPLNLDAGAPLFLLAYLTVAAYAALAWRLWKRAPTVSVAMIAFMAMVLPMLGVVQNGPQLAADRYTYHPAPALALLLGAAFVVAWRRHRALTGAAALSLLGTYSALTWQQTKVWHDSFTLWTRVLEISDDAAIGHNALGNILMTEGRVSLALDHFQRAVDLDPGLAAAHDNLGVALARLGRASESIEHFQRAIAVKDESDEAYNNWGVVLMQQGDLRGAIDRFSKAVEIDSLSSNAQVNWGSALARLGDLDGALAHFKRATEISPAHQQAHANWGAVLAQLGRWPEAAEQLTIALQLDPSDADVRANLDRVRQEQARKPAGPSGRAP